MTIFENAEYTIRYRIYCLIFGLFLLSFPRSSTAQDTESKENILKTNLFGLALFNLNVNYEHKIGKKLSAGAILGYRFPKEMSFNTDVANGSGDNLSYQGKARISGIIINPYARFYPKEALKGFYLELFARYYRYVYELPYNYDKGTHVVEASAIGRISAFGFGLNVGGQITPGERIVIDLFIGGGLGSAATYVESRDSDLDENDYRDIKEIMEQTEDAELTVYGREVKDVSYGADDEHVWAEVKGLPVPFLRAGISLGFRF